MDSNQEEIPSVREKSLNPRHLTIMIIRSVGKMRSFKVSRRLIFWTSIFFLAYIIASLYIINSYFDLRHRYDIQSQKMEYLEKNLFKTDKILLQTNQHVAILEDYIQDVQEQRKVESQPNSIEEAKEVVDRIKEDVYEGIDGKGKTAKVVEIEDMVIQKESNGMSVDFKLVNTKPGEDAMEGYIHIVAMNKENDSPPEWNHPKDKLEEGLPVNFRRGQPFLIQRFKPYHRTFNLSSDYEFPATIRVLVYDRSGTLLLEKKFEVSNVS